MHIDQRDKVFLKHILEEIQFLLTEIYKLEINELRGDAVRQRACIKSIEIIGEASKNISQELKDKHSEIEWKLIAGMRDRLTHRYFSVDWEIIWDVVKNKIPSLENKINDLLKSMQE